MTGEADRAESTVANQDARAQSEIDALEGKVCPLARPRQDLSTLCRNYDNIWPVFGYLHTAFCKYTFSLQHFFLLRFYKIIF